MHGVAALLAAAAVAYALSRLLRVPAIPLLLLAGLGISSFARPDVHVVEDALVLGVSFLLFVVGLELDPRRTRAQRDAAVRVGMVQFLVLAILGYLTALALGFSSLSAGYIALALTASSTLVNVRLLQRRRQMFEPFGRLVMGVLLLQDVLVLLLLPVLVQLTAGIEPALYTAGAIALLGGCSFFVQKVGGDLLLRMQADGELLLLGALALLFAFLGAADLLGLPLVVGAFLAGTALSRFPINGVVRSEVAPIGDFFAAIFFTALGAAARFPTPTELWQAGVLALLVIVVTPPLVTVLAERAGFSARTSIEAGLLLSNTSEISLVIVLAGMLQGQIGSDVFTVIALVTLVTMLTTPLLATDRVAWWLVHWHPARRRARKGGAGADAPSGHVLLLGAGSTGMPLVEDLLVAGCPIVVVDDDPAVLAQLDEAGVTTVRGDASDDRVLLAAGADRARAVSSTIRRPRDNEPLLRIASGRPVLVRVFDQEDADWISDRGGTPVLYSEATADSLMEWFEALKAAPAGAEPA